MLVTIDAIAFLPDRKGCDKATAPAHSASIEIPDLTATVAIWISRHRPG